MANYVIGTTRGNGSVATPGGGGQAFLLTYPLQHAKYVRVLLAQEEAAMDAEDILTQAEEANGLDPVG